MTQTLCVHLRRSPVVGLHLRLRLETQFPWLRHGDVAHLKRARIFNDRNA